MNTDEPLKPCKRRRPEVELLTGVVVDACAPGIHIDRAAAQRLRVKEGDHLEIECDERGTMIVRQLRNCDCFLGFRPGYAYLDGESIFYLNIQSHHKVTLRKSKCHVDVP